MKEMGTQSGLACGLSMDRAEHAVRWTVVMLFGLNMMGCALLSPPPPPAAPPVSCMAEQSEIERLQQLLAEKEALIQSQQAHQQDQARVLQATTSQAARAQVKLRRMATQPDAASTLAEVEVAMETLKSAKITAPHQTMQSLAQHLLDDATAAYGKDDFAMTVDSATQSREIIDMVKGQANGKAASTRKVTVTFQTPIPLQTRIDCKLRQLPRGNAPTLKTLKKASALMALAYRGDWLRIQTEDGDTGWLLNSLVEALPVQP